MLIKNKFWTAYLIFTLILHLLYSSVGGKQKNKLKIEL